MSQQTYRPDIDGLRAIAVSAVLIFHAFPDILPGGFVGVDVFFVISGYLITGIILKVLGEGDFSLVRFYARRIRRIFPALAIVLASCLVAGWFLLLPDEFAQLGKHAAAGAAFMSNIVLWRESGYFEDAASQTILLHLWSLGIEEQFYLAWPLLLVAAWRLRIPATWVIAAILIVSFGLNMWSIRFDPVATFYSPLTRSWELAIGALLAAPSGAFRLPLPARHILSIVGGNLILFAALWLTEAMTFPGWRALLPTLGAAAIIAAGPPGILNRVLATSLPVAIGKISYPLYLWHWPLLVFPAIVLGAEVPVSVRAVVLAMSVVLAASTHILLERPLGSERFLLPKAGALAALVAVVASVGALSYGSQGLPARPTMAPYVESQNWLSQRLAWDYAENSNCLDRFPSPDRREGWWFCVLEKDAPPTIFLMGNSFANHLYPGVVAIPEFASENVLQFGSCDPGIGLSFTYSPSHPCFGEARQRQEAMVSRIVDENPTIRRAILSSPWPSFDAQGEAVDYFDPSIVEGQYRSVPAVPGETSYDAFMRALERRVAFLGERDIQAVLVLMSPELGYSPDTCYGGRPFRPAANSCQISLLSELQKQKRFRQGLHQIQGRHPHLAVFDPLPSFCKGDTCDLKDAHGPLLRDVGHLSMAGSMRVGAALGEWLRTQVGNTR